MWLCSSPGVHAGVALSDPTAASKLWEGCQDRGGTLSASPELGTWCGSSSGRECTSQIRGAICSFEQGFLATFISSLFNLF